MNVFVLYQYWQFGTQAELQINLSGWVHGWVAGWLYNDYKGISVPIGIEFGLIGTELGNYDHSRTFTDHLLYCWNNMLHYCSAWSRPKLNTKIGLHTTTTTHHHYPPQELFRFSKYSRHARKLRFGM